MNRCTKLVSVLALSITMLFSGCYSNGRLENNQSEADGKWTVGDWKVSTPEEQGMDSTSIYEMLKKIQKDESNIHSVLIVKNGYLVTEAYFDPSNAMVKHDFFSASKSITSALVGIALGEKHLDSIDQRVVEFFTDYRISNLDEAKESMTVKDLLTMSTGQGRDTTSSIVTTGDWTETFLNLSVPEKPGERFVYNSGATYMLSAILQKATGESALDYASKKLFKPLGISDVRWETSPDGTNCGGWGIYMTPRDMAKFGYLFLKEGIWNGKQIVPREWVKESTKKQIDTGNDGPGYGFQWWLNDFGGYCADGYAGQYIFVVPDSDLVVVFTGGLNSADKNPPTVLMKNYIIPAIKGSAPIPANPKVLKKLGELLEELKKPKSQGKPISDIAWNITGRTYTMEANSYGIESLTISFNKEKECKLVLVQNGITQELAVGMDGAFQKNKAQKLGTFKWYPNYEEVALKGHWNSQNEFILDWHYVGEPYGERYSMRFDKNSLTVEITEKVQDVMAIVPGVGTLHGVTE